MQIISWYCIKILHRFFLFGNLSAAVRPLTLINDNIKPTKSGLFAVAVRPDRIRRKQIGFSKIYGERRSDGTIFQDPLVRFQSSAFLRCVRCHVRDVQLYLLGLLARASAYVRKVALQDPVGQQANLIFMRRPLCRYEAVQLFELFRIGEGINVVFDLGRQRVSPVGITLQA